MIRSMVTVVIVDDDRDFLGFAAGVLGDMGVEVVATARTGSAALRAVKETRPDAVLVDIGLPDLDGVELAYELAALPSRPRIVVTSSDNDALGVAGHERGELPFVPKDEIASDSMRRLLSGE